MRDPDVLFASDEAWWTVYGDEAMRACRNSELWCANMVRGLNYIEAVDMPGLSDNPRRIHEGGNSGYQAVGLAHLWGADRIILLGYDMQRGPHGESHFHGDHAKPLENLGPLDQWVGRFAPLANDLRRRGVDVINASRVSAIQCFERLTLEAALTSGTAAVPWHGFDDEPLTIMCVLKSGGDFDADYVRRLRDGIARNMTIPYRFVCLSDVPVPCERIALRHDWPGWWSKIELFRPDVITAKTLYLDLDTVIVGKMDRVAGIADDFSMFDVHEHNHKVGNSGAMWIGRPFPHVYERFAERPQYWIDYHKKMANQRYMGDQAFISDSFADIPKLHKALPGFFKSYKWDGCQQQIPSGCSVVCFGGEPRPRNAGGWVKEVWV